MDEPYADDEFRSALENVRTFDVQSAFSSAVCVVLLTTIPRRRSVEKATPKHKKSSNYEEVCVCLTYLRFVESTLFGMDLLLLA